MCFSDDTFHDSHAVEFYLHSAIKYLENENVMITRVVIFSDGCANQYKGKVNFADLSLSIYATERNYYGSEHGKGEGDGEIGVINRAIDRAILGRQVIVREMVKSYISGVQSTFQQKQNFLKGNSFMSNLVMCHGTDKIVELKLSKGPGSCTKSKAMVRIPLQLENCLAFVRFVRWVGHHALIPHTWELVK